MLLQGEPEDIACDKCRLAAEQVGAASMLDFREAWQPRCSNLLQHAPWRMLEQKQPRVLLAATAGTGQPLQVQAVYHPHPCMLPAELAEPAAHLTAPKPCLWQVLQHTSLPASKACGSLQCFVPMHIVYVILCRWELQSSWRTPASASQRLGACQVGAPQPPSAESMQSFWNMQCWRQAWCTHFEQGARCCISN